MELGGIVLQCGDWRALVLPSFGANLISLSYCGKEILRTPKAMSDLEKTPCLYGNPILFPANRTAGGHFTFMGTEYSMPINEPAHNNHLHGSLHCAPFSVIRQTAASLCCTCHNSGSLFPIPFTIDISFLLNSRGLTQTFLLSSDNALPVMLGLHTTFCEPSWFSVPIGERWEWNNRFTPTGNLLPLNAREQCYRTGYTPQGEAISGFFTAAERTARIGEIEYSASEGFNQWILYNGGGNSGFLCVEPQSAPVNGLNIKNACKIIPAGGKAFYQVRFTSPLQT